MLSDLDYLVTTLNVALLSSEDQESFPSLETYVTVISASPEICYMKASKFGEREKTERE